MNTVAIVGAGAIGAHLTHALAALELTREIRLIDSQSAAARGKALDIQQAGSLEGCHTRVRAADDVSAASGAALIALSDGHQDVGEPDPAADFELFRRIAAANPRTPIVFARADHHATMARALRELQLSPARLVGSAPEALVSSARAMVALAAGMSPSDVSVPAFGVPGGWVFGWNEATVAGRPVSAALPAHELMAVEARVRASWPPGPYSLASAAARVIAGMLTRSRCRFTCFAALEGEWRHRVGAVSVALGPEGIISRDEPTLSARERVQLATALSA
jgi:malate dehydrogenase